jgi:cysteinyl-tRNA synthetase
MAACAPHNSSAILIYSFREANLIVETNMKVSCTGTHHSDFPEKISALLYAREIALRNDKKKDAKQFQKDLAKLGIVIKDERNGQYVRFANYPH